VNHGSALSRLNRPASGNSITVFCRWLIIPDYLYNVMISVNIFFSIREYTNGRSKQEDSSRTCSGKCLFTGGSNPAAGYMCCNPATASTGVESLGTQWTTGHDEHASTDTNEGFFTLLADCFLEKKQSVSGFLYPLRGTVKNPAQLEQHFKNSNDLIRCQHDMVYPQIRCFHTGDFSSAITTVCLLQSRLREFYAIMFNRPGKEME